jgi:hypothetical protein
MMPTRYMSKAEVIRTKKRAAEIAHLTAPLKGLDLSSRLSGNTGGSDSMTAPILKNFVIFENRIQARPGSRRISVHVSGAPVETIIPYFGVPNAIAVAVDGEICRASDMSVEQAGFTSNDWHWTSFSNLGDKDYTVAANGQDGVWSWDGTTTGWVKEVITAVAGNTWFDQNDIQIVLSHMNRLWFADNTRLVVYYLPVQQKSGEIKFLPLTSVFKRGGAIRAMYTWSIDGGSGLDDKLVIFSTNGECAIYGGIDPDSDFGLVGVFRFDSPMSKHCVVNYGGELHVLTSTGLLPMSTMIRAETEQLGQYDKGVVSAFREVATPHRNNPGWSVILDHGNGRTICNMPLGYVGAYRQMVRNMSDPAWMQWEDVRSRCWGWIDNKLYFGDDSGGFWTMDETLYNDGGAPILVDVQWAWSDYGTPAGKMFKLLRPYFFTDGVPRPFVDMRADYDITPPQNQPDVTFTTIGTEWDLGTWDVDYWAAGAINVASWNGVAAFGRIGAPRITASITNCIFAISGIDVIYEKGSIFG